MVEAQLGGAAAGPLSPPWTVALRGLVAGILAPYMHAAYRIRGWGRLPFRRGPTLVVSNHVHDLDAVAVVVRLTLAGPWRDPVFVAVSRRLFEPGYMAVRAPRLTRWLSRSDWSPFFGCLGFLPIENELRERPLASLAWSIGRAHGDVPLSEVLEEAVVRALDPDLARARTGDVLRPDLFHRAQVRVPLEALREPYRSELLQRTRVQVEEDLGRMREVLRRGGTLYIAPEGRPSPDGRLHRLRDGLWALLPLAPVYLAPISYDPFLGRRLSLLFRVLPLPPSADVATMLKAARPVTVSQLLAAWLSRRREGEPFAPADALRGVSALLAALAPHAFVDPALRRDPEGLTRAALGTLLRLGLLRPSPGGLARGDRRRHPKFPAVDDIVAHQAAMFRDTCEALGQVRPAGSPGPGGPGGGGRSGENPEPIQ
jgi:hypothetical protein